MAREEFLEELLEESVEALRRPDRKPKAHKHPWLRELAIKLYDETGSSDPKLLLEVAAALCSDCDERTAQNYAKDAREHRPEK